MNNNNSFSIPSQPDGYKEQPHKKSSKGKRVAATAATAVAGGALGSGITYGASKLLHTDEAEAPKPNAEAPVEEQHFAAAEKPQSTPAAEPHTEEAAAKVDANAEPDYPRHHGADPVTPSPEVHPAVNDAAGDVPQVQILGVYEAPTEDGQTMQTAVISNGEEVAAIVDVNGDGTADVFVWDENHNEQIEEGEVHDISGSQLQMEDLQNVYEAQQQEEVQQEHDTFSYSTNDDQQDYNNDVDLQFI